MLGKRFPIPVPNLRYDENVYEQNRKKIHPTSVTSQVLQLYKAYASERNIFGTCLVHRLPGVSAPYLPWPWPFSFSYYLFILNSDNTKVTVKKLEKLKIKYNKIIFQHLNSQIWIKNIKISKESNEFPGLWMSLARWMWHLGVRAE